MIFYSHLVIASLLEPRLLPYNREEYYLGSVIPDIRYSCGLQRRQTHLPLEKIAEYITYYPHLQSFVLGYLVHCGADQFDFTGYSLGRFPLNLLLAKLPLRLTQYLIEYCYLQTVHLEMRLSESSNEMLNRLGIDPGCVALYAQQFNRFLASPSLTSSFTTAQSLGFLHMPGAPLFLRLVQNFAKLDWLNELLFARTGLPAFNQQMTEYIMTQPRIRVWDEARQI